jgi:hypothetical protein
MAELAVEPERHHAATLEPAAEHEVMLAFVGAVALDCRDQRVVVGRARAHGVEHAIDRRVPAMLVINVDRSEKVEIAASEPSAHGESPSRRRRALCSTRSA